ncbi:IS5/IS1182 family transposase, partial [Streptomyces sp. XM83C]|nr:IS5/IS1182 family transposase [Streptomyces sp. XM83C]
MTDLVERLVPDELWALFRRVVPPTEVIRPQGGGKRRAGDR